MSQILNLLNYPTTLQLCDVVYICTIDSLKKFANEDSNAGTLLQRSIKILLEKVNNLNVFNVNNICCYRFLYYPLTGSILFKCFEYIQFDKVPLKRKILDKGSELTNYENNICNKQVEEVEEIYKFMLKNESLKFLTSIEKNELNLDIEIKKLLIILLPNYNQMKTYSIERLDFIQKLRTLIRYLYIKNYLIVPFTSFQDMCCYTFGVNSEDLISKNITKNGHNKIITMRFILYHGYFLPKKIALYISKLAINWIYNEMDLIYDYHISQLTLEKSNLNVSSKSRVKKQQKNFDSKLHNTQYYANDLLNKSGGLHITISYIPDPLETLKYYEKSITINKVGHLEDFMVYAFIYTPNVVAARVKTISHDIDYCTGGGKDIHTCEKYKNKEPNHLPDEHNSWDLSYKKCSEYISSMKERKVTPFQETIKLVSTEVNTKPAKSKKEGNIPRPSVVKLRPFPISYESIPNNVINPTAALLPLIAERPFNHVTIAHTACSRASQSVVDLERVVAMESGYHMASMTQNRHKFYKVSRGVARDFGEGYWSIYLDYPIKFSAIFTARLQT